MGFVTPIVHALTAEDWIIHLWFDLKVNAEILYLASNVAKPKVKGIDGKFFQLWIIWVNQMQRYKSYQP